jgi:hypothetical protein
MNRFLDEHKDNWRRLEDLLTMLGGTSLRGLSKMEVREFGELYRRAASDLAIARAETRDPKLINYLNSLVIRAHGKIYRAESQGVSLVGKFFAEDLPRTFRANWRYMAIAFGVFAGFALFGFIATWVDTDFTHFVSLSGITTQIQANNHWWERLNEENQVGASSILSNNILVHHPRLRSRCFFWRWRVLRSRVRRRAARQRVRGCYKLNHRSAMRSQALLSVTA